MKSTQILSVLAIVILASCGSDPQVEVNPCNCFDAMEHGNTEYTSIIEPCNDRMKEKDFQNEYNRCKLADMRGVPVDEVKIPEPKEVETPVLEIPTSGVYNIDTAESSIRWTGEKITGEKHTGTLQATSGNVVIDGSTLKSGEIIIDMSTLTDTDIKDDAERAKLEGHLKSADFFNVGEHPSATFAFESATVLTNFRAQVDGTLTIRGISKAVKAPVALVKTSSGGLILSGAMIINRTDYNVKFGSSAAADFFIKDEFALNFSLHGSPAQ